MYETTFTVKFTIRDDDLVRGEEGQKLFAYCLEKDLRQRFDFITADLVPQTEDLSSAGLSILQPWAAQLGLRHQGVLVSAVRGCDSVPREDPIKQLVRYYRACLLRAHCGDAAKASSFMIEVANGQEFAALSDPVLKSMDHYPLHYILHFIHAAQIMGYKSPSNRLSRQWWRDFYHRACRKLHLNPETWEQLDERLNADEQTFGAQQNV